VFALIFDRHYEIVDMTTSPIAARRLCSSRLARKETMPSRSACQRAATRNVAYEAKSSSKLHAGYDLRRNGKCWFQPTESRARGVVKASGVQKLVAVVRLESGLTRDVRVDAPVGPAIQPVDSPSYQDGDRGIYEAKAGPQLAQVA
jgi:hypothetical protein